MLADCEASRFVFLSLQQWHPGLPHALIRVQPSKAIRRPPVMYLGHLTTLHGSGRFPRELGTLLSFEAIQRAMLVAKLAVRIARLGPNQYVRACPVFAA